MLYALRGVVLSAVLSALLLAGCATARSTGLSLVKQGVFSSGGTVTAPVAGKYDETKNWLDLERSGNTAHVDHANVFYQIPAGSEASPVVYLHGYGQSRTGWMATPDGREGWSDIFLKKGRAAFLVDQPRRGAAGAAVRMVTNTLDAWGAESKLYKPGDQAWYTHFRIGRVAPGRYEGSQFPAGKEVQNQFFRQMTPNTGDYDENLFGSVLSDVLKDVRKMTGKKSVLVTHSQGGGPGWTAAKYTDRIAAIVAVEPGGAPGADTEDFKTVLSKKIPVTFYFGDYIDNGDTRIQATGMWRMMRGMCYSFAENYRAQGGDATVIDLPKAGITGNSHFLFQELNNKEIADHVEAWLKTRGL